jgi:hypothetical protein
MQAVGWGGDPGPADERRGVLTEGEPTVAGVLMRLRGCCSGLGRALGLGLAGAGRAASSLWSPREEGRCLAGSGPNAKPAMPPSAANAAAASSTSLRPLAVPAWAAWVTAARAAGGTTAATRVPAPEATAEASRWAGPGLPVEITICTASALNCGLNFRRCSGMEQILSVEPRVTVQDL